MRRRLAGVIFAKPPSLSTNAGEVVSTVLDTVAVRFGGIDPPRLEEVAMASLSEGTSSKVTMVVLGIGVVVEPLQGGSPSSSLGTGVFERVEQWGALEGLLEMSEESTIHKKEMTGRGLDEEEGGDSLGPQPRSLITCESCSRLAWTTILTSRLTVVSHRKPIVGPQPRRMPRGR